MCDQVLTVTTPVASDNKSDRKMSTHISSPTIASSVDEVKQSNRSFLSFKRVAQHVRLVRKSVSMNFPVCHSKTDSLPISEGHKGKDPLTLDSLPSAKVKPGCPGIPKSCSHLDFRPTSLSIVPITVSSAPVTTDDGQLQTPFNDDRPLNDYDSPWDLNRRLSAVVTEIVNTPDQAKMVHFNMTSSMSTTDIITTTSRPTVSRCPLRSTSFTLELNKAYDSHSNVAGNLGHDEDDKDKVVTTMSISRTCPAVDTLAMSSDKFSCDNLSFGAPRKKPLFIFAPGMLSPLALDIDISIVLEKQGFYHGSITRIDAEHLLRNMREGSYLVRNCESTKKDFSLSLKSAKGFMHMKIVKQNDGKYVLGVFSKPFKNIPEMIHYYSINKLAIRGAEHMSLRYPIIDQLL
ncbi:SH2 domain-containing adapter protein F [Halotydeus destructor]|nr:SH2 domain-containing adapter protein F [Halotydeus destructor]